MMFLLVIVEFASRMISVFAAIMSETGVMSCVVLAQHLSYSGYIGVRMLMMFFLVILELASSAD